MINHAVVLSFWMLHGLISLHWEQKQMNKDENSEVAVKLGGRRWNRDATDFFCRVIIVINSRWWPVHMGFEAWEMESFSACSKVSPDSICGLNELLKCSSHFVNSAVHFFDWSWCHCMGLRAWICFKTSLFVFPGSCLCLERHEAE